MIALEDLAIASGSFRIEGVSLTIPQGHYGVLMGPTGCGKTTVLEAICGLKTVTQGAIRLMGRDVTRLKAAERGVGYVPQDGALFNTMTVRDHLAFALHVRKWDRKAVKRRVAELAELLDIGHLLHRKPFGLSGGESQRVALGRALSCHPRVLCLDEPLSALDHDMRFDLCSLLDTVKEKMHVTTIHVTHDRNEAARLADCLFTFVDGCIREVS